MNKTTKFGAGTAAFDVDGKQREAPLQMNGIQALGEKIHEQQDRIRTAAEFPLT